MQLFKLSMYHCIMFKKILFTLLVCGAGALHSQAQSDNAPAPKVVAEAVPAKEMKSDVAKKSCASESKSCCSKSKGVAASSTAKKGQKSCCSSKGSGKSCHKSEGVKEEDN